MAVSWKTLLGREKNSFDFLGKFLNDAVGLIGIQGALELRESNLC